MRIAHILLKSISALFAVKILVSCTSAPIEEVAARTVAATSSISSTATSTHAAVEVSAISNPCKPDPDWNDPATPTRIYGNSWYVGTCGLSAILITSPQGHVLIDGATETSAALIEASIRKLGFRIEDVHYILSSHEHFDHAGGIAQLQHDSGAAVLAGTPAVGTLRSGKVDREDPQYFSSKGFPAIASVRAVADGDIVSLGSIATGRIEITAHATPGHTLGSTSWTWDSCESNVCRHIVYADSLSVISDDQYRYSDEAKHPGVLAAFRKSIARVAALPCEILLTPHPGASDLWSRLGPTANASLIDSKACVDYAQSAFKNLNTRIAKEQTSPVQNRRNRP